MPTDVSIIPWDWSKTAKKSCMIAKGMENSRDLEWHSSWRFIGFVIIKITYKCRSAIADVIV